MNDEDNPARWLERPDLFEYITEKELDKKIVGEVENRKAIFLICCGSFVENKTSSSFNLCVSSSSGAGKDWICSKILELFPQEKVVSRTRISPTVFNYWHNAAFEPEWTWNGKVCYLEDVSDLILNHEVFKVMASRGSFATLVIKQRVYDIEIKGKPVILITTATAEPKAEILRRFPIISLDESKEQTRAIMKKIGETAKRGCEEEYDESITKAMRLLRTVKVNIPFIDDLENKFPESNIIIRTHWGRFLDLIKASAALYQYQRKKDENGYIIAEEKDLEIAVNSLKQTSSNRMMIPLTKKQKKLLEIIHTMKDRFSMADLRKKVTFYTEKNLYNTMDKFEENDFFEVDEENREESRRPVRVYSLKPEFKGTIVSTIDYKMPNSISS